MPKTKIINVQTINLDNDDLCFLEKTFDKVSRSTISDISEQLRRDKNNGSLITYLTYHKPFTYKFDHSSLKEIIFYFVEKYNLRTSSYSLRMFSKNNYIRNENNRGLLYRLDIDTKMNVSKQSPIINLDEPSRKALAKIRANYAKDVYAFLNENTHIQKKVNFIYKKPIPTKM